MFNKHQLPSYRQMLASIRQKLSRSTDNAKLAKLRKHWSFYSPHLVTGLRRLARVIVALTYYAIYLIASAVIVKSVLVIVFDWAESGSEIVWIFVWTVSAFLAVLHGIERRLLRRIDEAERNVSKHLLSIFALLLSQKKS